jgi:hypothetical protein
MADLRKVGQGETKDSSALIPQPEANDLSLLCRTVVSTPREMFWYLGAA